MTSNAGPASARHMATSGTRETSNAGPASARHMATSGTRES
jgi:hypothetical protein